MNAQPSVANVCPYCCEPCGGWCHEDCRERWHAAAAREELAQMDERYLREYEDPRDPMTPDRFEEF